jgi:gas vesicle protein
VRPSLELIKSQIDILDILIEQKLNEITNYQDSLENATKELEKLCFQQDDYRQLLREIDHVIKNQKTT